MMEPHRHDHITGRMRRKWFYRGRHRPAGHRESVAELVESIGTGVRCTQPWRTSGFHFIQGGRYYCFHGQMFIPDEVELQSGIVVLASPEAVVNFPADD